MESRLKERRFISIEEIQAESQQVLNTLTPADFSECFQKRQNRWDRCIQAQGDYIEGDDGNIHVVTSKFSEILGNTSYISNTS
jgi:hypothetical protein